MGVEGQAFAQCGKAALGRPFVQTAMLEGEERLALVEEDHLAEPVAGAVGLDERHDAGRAVGLQRLAKIVHAADVAADIDADPVARGLEAIASGYSLRYPNDMENLAKQFEVYDALYAWCRLGRGERHDWQPEAMRRQAAER